MEPKYITGRPKYYVEDIDEYIRQCKLIHSNPRNVFNIILNMLTQMDKLIVV